MLSFSMEVFLKVVHYGTFTDAAQSLYVTPAAVMKHINLLEKKLGVVLLKRTRKGVSLTPAGESLYKDVLDIDRQWQSAIKKARALDGGLNVIRIGVSLMTSWQNLGKILPEVFKNYPEFKFQVVSFENSVESYLDLLNNLERDIDLFFGLVSDEARDYFKGTDSFVIEREKIRIAVPISNPLAEKDKLEISDLYDQTIMISKGGWDKNVAQLKEELSSRERITIKEFPYYDLDVFNEASRDNALVAVGKMSEEIFPLFKVLPIDWDYCLSFGMYYKEEPREEVKKFLSVVKTLIKN